MRSLTEGIEVKERRTDKGGSSGSQARTFVGLGILVVLAAIAGWLYFRGGDEQNADTRSAAEQTAQLQAAMQPKQPPPPPELPVENRAPRGTVNK